MYVYQLWLVAGILVATLLAANLLSSQFQSPYPLFEIDDFSKAPIATSGDKNG